MVKQRCYIPDTTRNGVRIIHALRWAIQREILAVSADPKRRFNAVIEDIIGQNDIISIIVAVNGNLYLDTDIIPTEVYDNTHIRLVYDWQAKRLKKMQTMLYPVLIDKHFYTIKKEYVGTEKWYICPNGTNAVKTDNCIKTRYGYFGVLEGNIPKETAVLGLRAPSLN